MAKGFKGGLPGNMQGMMQQVQQMQKELMKAQEEAKEMTAEGTAGGGMVKAVANGRFEVVSLEIEKDVINPEDSEMLQDLVIAAVNGALTKVQDQTKERLASITGGMNIPGLF